MPSNPEVPDEYKNVPKSKVGSTVQDCINDGADQVIVIKQPSNGYTIRAMFGADRP